MVFFIYWIETSIFFLILFEIINTFKILNNTYFIAYLYGIFCLAVTKMMSH